MFCATVKQKSGAIRFVLLWGSVLSHACRIMRLCMQRIRLFNHFSFEKDHSLLRRHCALLCITNIGVANLKHIAVLASPRKNLSVRSQYQLLDLAECLFQFPFEIHDLCITECSVGEFLLHALHTFLQFFFRHRCSLLYMRQ